MKALSGLLCLGKVIRGHTPFTRHLNIDMSYIYCLLEYVRSRGECVRSRGECVRSRVSLGTVCLSVYGLVVSCGTGMRGLQRDY